MLEYEALEIRRSVIDDHSDPDTIARGILGISKRKKDLGNELCVAVSAKVQFSHACNECLLEPMF